MKKLSVTAVSVVGFILIAAPIYVKTESRGLLINGRNTPFGNAELVNGVWAIPVDQFIKGFGGTLTMEQAGFRMESTTRLVTMVPSSTTDDKHKIDTVKSQKVYAPGGTFSVRKAGFVGNVFTFNGRKYISVNDVARALGGTFTAPAGNLAPGQTLSLNFAVNGDGIIAVHQ